MLLTMHFFEFRAYERSAPPPAAVNFHVIFFLCICWQDSGGCEKVLPPSLKSLNIHYSKRLYKIKKCVSTILKRKMPKKMFKCESRVECLRVNTNSFYVIVT